MSGEEMHYINKAFDSNWIAPLGENVDEFERALCDYTGSSYAVALSSGTAAIHLGLIQVGVSAGDEVVCPSFTFSASANPIRYLGAVPVFVDSEAETWNMDPALLEEAITDRIKKGKKPKAVVVVHLYGMPAKMNEIVEICNTYEIPVLEDAAESLGARVRISFEKVDSTSGGREDGSHLKGGVHLRGENDAEYSEKVGTTPPRTSRAQVDPTSAGIWRHTGIIGDIGVLSFNGNKIITTSGGGAVLTNNKVYADHIRFLATQARDPAPHYQHSHIGYNYRMSNILAGIGRGQIRVIEDRVKRRREIFDYYREKLSDIEGISMLTEPNGHYANRWLTTIIVDPEKTDGVTREDIRLKLEEVNIESRPLWKPMHLQPVFNKYPHYSNELSGNLFDRGLCLPSGSSLYKTDLDRVITYISDTCKEKGIVKSKI